MRWPSQPPPPPPLLLSLIGGRPGGPEVRFFVTELLRWVLAATSTASRRCGRLAAAAGAATSRCADDAHCSEVAVLAMAVRCCSAACTRNGEGAKRVSPGRMRGNE